MTESNDDLCPCGSGAPFAGCCEPIIKGTRESETAEELMRARYSAFVTHDIDFIVASTHTRSRKEIDLDFIREWSETSTWLGLEIFETKQVNDNKAFVSFEAQFTQGGEEQRCEESHLPDPAEALPRRKIFKERVVERRRRVQQCIVDAVLRHARGERGDVLLDEPPILFGQR